MNGAADGADGADIGDYSHINQTAAGAGGSVIIIYPCRHAPSQRNECSR